MFGKLGSGQEVIDRPNSHVHESVLPILGEALSRIHLKNEPFVVRQVDFDRIVGQKTCVATSDQDEILYAQRAQRAGLSRFVKNRDAEDTSSVVVILKKADKAGNTYVLITAFIGTTAPPEPWDRNATPESRIFWLTHALVWGTEEVIEGTETTQYPW